MKTERLHSARRMLRALEDYFGAAVEVTVKSDQGTQFSPVGRSYWAITFKSPLGGDIEVRHLVTKGLSYLVSYQYDTSLDEREYIELARVAEQWAALAVTKDLWKLHSQSAEQDSDKGDDEDNSQFRQTTCKHCELDIEGELDSNGEVVGYWRDRGGNWTCAKSIDGGLHSPVPE